MTAPKLRSRKRTAATVLAAVAIIGLGGVLAGCGADDDKAANSQSAGDANSATNPAAAGLPVPNVVYQDAAVALDTFKKVGFTNVKVEASDKTTPVDNPAEWVVDSQSVLPGTNATGETEIVLTCVKKKLGAYARENTGTGGSHGPPVVVSGGR